MKKILYKIVAILSLLVVSVSMFAVVGCAGGDGDNEVYTVTVSKKAITLDEYSQPFTLTAKVVGSDGKEVSTPQLTWASNDTNIVTVTNGTVTVVGVGETQVVCSYQDFSGICVVTVEKYYEPEVKIIPLNKNVQIPYVENSTINVMSTVYENGVVVQMPITYTSSNTVVATVDENGLVTIKKAGYTEITLSVTKNGYVAKAVVKLTVGQVQSEEELKDVVTPDKDWQI